MFRVISLLPLLNDSERFNIQEIKFFSTYFLRSDTNAIRMRRLIVRTQNNFFFFNFVLQSQLEPLITRLNDSLMYR